MFVCFFAFFFLLMKMYVINKNKKFLFFDMLKYTDKVDGIYIKCG